MRAESKAETRLMSVIRNYMFLKAVSLTVDEIKLFCNLLSSGNQSHGGCWRWWWWWGGAGGRDTPWTRTQVEREQLNHQRVVLTGFLLPSDFASHKPLSHERTDLESHLYRLCEKKGHENVWGRDGAAEEPDPNVLLI